MKKVLYLIMFVFLCFFNDVRAEETLILLDSSLSMNEDFYGKPKYIAAVDEAKKVLLTLDSSRKIGLRTIGIKLNESILNYIKDFNLMCKATQLDVPIRQNNIQYINASLNDVIPLGTTPIEYSLRTAINSDFSYGSHLKHIILITDGAESCNADPCKFIREVMVGRKDIRIDVLAISVTNEDFQQLKCLSDNTNGTIINITNTNELQEAYKSVLTTPVKVTTDVDFNNKVKASKSIRYKNIHFETFE